MPQIELFDAVRTTDGREGTVVHIHDQPGLPLAYEVEFGSSMELQTVAASEIREVTWKARLSEYKIHKPEGMSVSEWKRLMDQRKAEFEKRASAMTDEEFTKLIRPADQGKHILDTGCG